MPNRFKKLFALGEVVYRVTGDQLTECLRDLASQYNGGHYSLSRLTPRQQVKVERDLQKRANRMYQQRRSDTILALNLVGIPADQKNMLYDLVAAVFVGSTVDNFRGWLKNSHGVDHERFLDSTRMRGIVKALKEMRERGYKIK